MGLRSMQVLSLCSGVGGLDLGVRIVVPDSRVVCYVEKDPYCHKVIQRRIKDECLDDAPIWDDVKTFDGKPWRGKVDCVIGGYPCQPFSVAGKKKGEQDERHLWPDIKRIVEEVGPSVCFFENVANHLLIGFQSVHDDLRGMGFRVETGLFTAAEVGGSQERERLFILGFSNCSVGEGNLLETSLLSQKNGKEKGSGEFVGGCREIILFPPGRNEITCWGWGPLPAEPELCGLVDGISNRTNRYRVAGNSVFPLVAAYAWRVLESSFKVGKQIQKL